MLLKYCAKSVKKNKCRINAYLNLGTLDISEKTMFPREQSMNLKCPLRTYISEASIGTPVPIFVED